MSEGRHAARADMDPQPWTMSVLRYIQMYQKSPDLFLVMVRGTSKNSLLMAELLSQTFQVDARAVRASATLAQDDQNEIRADLALQINKTMAAGINVIVVPSYFSLGGNFGFEKKLVDEFHRTESAFRLEKASNPALKNAVFPRLHVLSTYDSPRFIEWDWTCGQGVVYTEQNRAEVLSKRPGIPQIKEEEMSPKQVEELSHERKTFLERLYECRSMSVIEGLIEDDEMLSEPILSPAIHAEIQKAFVTRKLDELRIVFLTHLNRRAEADQIREWLKKRIT